MYIPIQGLKKQSGYIPIQGLGQVPLATPMAQSTIAIAPQGGGILSGIKSVASGAYGLAKGAVKGIVEMYTKPSPEVQQIEKVLIPEKYPIGTAITKPIAQAFVRTFAPFVAPLGKDIGERILLREIVPKIESGEMPANVVNQLDTLKKTAPQLVGDTAMAVLAAYSPTIFGKSAFVFKNAPIKSALIGGGVRGAETGLGFGAAQVLSSGTTDPMEAGKIMAGSIAVMGVLGAITSGAIPVAKEVKDRVVVFQNKLQQDLIARGYSTEEALQLAQQGGYAGGLPKKEPEKVGGVPEIPKELQPLAQEATKYKSAEEFVKAQGKPVYHGTPNQFDRFEMSKVGERGRTEGRGFYFTDKKDIAEKAYTSIPGGGGTTPNGRVIEAYLDLKKPMTTTQRKVSDSQWRNLLGEIDKKNNSITDNYGSIDEAIKLFKETGNTDLDFLSELGNINVLNHQELNDLFTRITGYDGVIKKEADGMIYVAFSPEQIKTKSQLTDFYNQAVKGGVKVSDLKKTESILKGTQEALPQLSQEIPRESLSSVERITQALKESKPLRGKQEALYSAERSQRMAKALAVGEKTGGEAGFYRELGQLKGELPKVQFEEIRSKIGQTDIDNLFGQIKDSKLLNFWDSVSARGGMVKVLEGRVPTEGELTLLGRVFPKEFIETILSKRSLFEKFKEASYQLGNLPRSVMASFDLSAPFRQGLFLTSHPKRFFGAFVDMFKAFGSENAFKSIQESIVRKPSFELMKDSKLALTEMNAILTQREEKFASSWAEKIPFVGKVIRASGRAYTGFLNKLRADVFDDLITKADTLGLAPRSNPQLTKEIANFVNVASGRGSLGSLQPAANALNSFFFSPKLMSSRLTLLNPVYYIKADPFVRKEALKSLFVVLGVGTSILGLAKLAGADVGTDPRSADFGKIIVGKTRIDVWGGFQQYIRMFAQLATGKYVSSVTGKITTLGEGYKPLTRFEILQRQVEAKEAPVFSLITTLLKGQNFLGEKIKITDEIKNRLTPMAISDIYEIYKNDPELLPLSGAGMFGFGLQTYSGDIPTEKEKKDTYKISQILGEQAKQREELSNASTLMYNELKKLPKEEAKTEFERLIKENPEMANKINDLIKDEQLGLTYTEKMIKQLGVENGQRAKYIVDEINGLKTKEEKKSYYQNLIDKKVITNQVNEQVMKLLK